MTEEEQVINFDDPEENQFQSNANKPKIEIEQPQQTTTQSQGQQGFLRKLISCNCTRGKEIQTEKQNELEINPEQKENNQINGDEKPKEEQSKSSPIVMKIDSFLQKLTSYYMLILYYSALLVVFWIGLNFLLDTNMIYLEFIGGCLVLAQIIKLIFIILLQDEWETELPYIDSDNWSSFRNIMIFGSIIFNMDIIYWIYLIYHKNKRDSVIEHMFAMCRFIDVLVFNFPIMLFCTYLQFVDTDTIQISFLIEAILNLLLIVNSFMHLNFFDGPGYSSICWSILYISDLYVRTILLVSVYVILESYNLSLYFIGYLSFIGILQVILFNDNSDGFFSTILGIIYYQYKTIGVIRFRELSFGNEQLDCDAQPNILVNNKNITTLTFSLIQNALNLYGSTNLVFVLLLFGAYPIIMNDQILLIAYGIGVGFYSLQVLHSLSIFYQSLRYKEYFKLS